MSVAITVCTHYWCGEYGPADARAKLLKQIDWASRQPSPEDIGDAG